MIHPVKNGIVRFDIDDGAPVVCVDVIDENDSFRFVDLLDSAGGQGNGIGAARGACRKHTDLLSRSVWRLR